MKPEGRETKLCHQRSRRSQDGPRLPWIQRRAAKREPEGDGQVCEVRNRDAEKPRRARSTGRRAGSERPLPSIAPQENEAVDRRSHSRYPKRQRTATPTAPGAGQRGHRERRASASASPPSPLSTGGKFQNSLPVRIHHAANLLTIAIFSSEGCVQDVGGVRDAAFSSIGV
jgi:hypothetical protein